MDEQKQKLIDRINQAQNVLVAVSSNPSVDQLAAAIGLTLVLNQMDKHGTAVFSGQVPSTLEFLKPEATLEKNTDSLRDFIIALDKSKADKLRYKVEDDVVRIFITPYKTSLSQKDLDFSQGDFNVDVVICLGVTEQQDLDTAITAHGRILHDATVVSISTKGQGSLGSINWVDPAASSLSEMMVSLTDGLSKKAMNNQVATAFLTGIVASTERFRGDNTTPRTMSAAAALMAAGANQQLIATELEPKPEPAPAPVTPYQPDAPQNGQPAQGENTEPPKHKAEPGTLEIAHDPGERLEATEEEETPEPEPPKEPEQPQIHVSENGELIMPGQEPQLPSPPVASEPEQPLPTISHVRGVGSNGQPTESDSANAAAAPKTAVKRELMTKMPELGDPNITANTNPEPYDPPTEELTLPALDAPLLSHTESVLPPPGTQPPAGTPPVAAPPLPPVSMPAPAPQPAEPAAPEPPRTLEEIEQSVSSPHLHMNDGAAPAAQLDDARSAVEAAINSAGGDTSQEPITALNAQPLGEVQHDTAAPAAAPYIPPANLFSPTPATPEPAAVIANPGFSEPTPGNTPADETLDMPLPGSMFAAPAAGAAPAAPGMSMNPSAPAPGGMPQQGGMNMGGPTPPPVPPPLVPPLQ